MIGLVVACYWWISCEWQFAPPSSEKRYYEEHEFKNRNCQFWFHGGSEWTDEWVVTLISRMNPRSCLLMLIPQFFHITMKCCLHNMRKHSLFFFTSKTNLEKNVSTKNIISPATVLTTLLSNHPSRHTKQTKSK